MDSESAQLRLDFFLLHPALGLTRTDKSIVLDASSRATFDKSIFACARKFSHLSIREGGSGRRHRVLCESPEEAERLLSCVILALKSLRKRYDSNDASPTRYAKPTLHSVNSSNFFWR